MEWVYLQEPKWRGKQTLAALKRKAEGFTEKAKELLLIKINLFESGDVIAEARLLKLK